VQVTMPFRAKQATGYAGGKY